MDLNFLNHINSLQSSQILRSLSQTLTAIWSRIHDDVQLEGQTSDSFQGASIVPRGFLLTTNFLDS